MTRIGSLALAASVAAVAGLASAAESAPPAPKQRGDMDPDRWREIKEDDRCRYGRMTHNASEDGAKRRRDDVAFDRADRRSGKVSARQQKKARKANRRAARGVK